VRRCPSALQNEFGYNANAAAESNAAARTRDEFCLPVQLADTYYYTVHAQYPDSIWANADTAVFVHRTGADFHYFPATLFAIALPADLFATDVSACAQHDANHYCPGDADCLPQFSDACAAFGNPADSYPGAYGLIHATAGDYHADPHHQHLDPAAADFHADTDCHRDPLTRRS